MRLPRPTAKPRDTAGSSHWPQILDPNHPQILPPQNPPKLRELLLQFPGLLYEFGDEQLALAERAFEASRRKYAFLGSYEV